MRQRLNDFDVSSRLIGWDLPQMTVSSSSSTTREFVSQSPLKFAWWVIIPYRL